MDAQRAQGTAGELPRNLYFGGEDWKAKKPDISEQDLAHVRNQRHVLIGHITHKAERLIAAVSKSLRDFDGTGNVDMVLDHVEQTILDLQKLTTNLVEDISAAVDRYGDGLDNLAATETPQTPAAAVEPSPQQAPAAAGPTLQPVHNHGTEDGPGLSCPEARTGEGLQGACMDKAPKVTPLTLVRSNAFSIISAGLDEAQRNRQAKAVQR